MVLHGEHAVIPFDTDTDIRCKEYRSVTDIGVMRIVTGSGLHDTIHDIDDLGELASVVSRFLYEHT